AKQARSSLARAHQARPTRTEARRLSPVSSWNPFSVRRRISYQKPNKYPEKNDGERGEVPMHGVAITSPMLIKNYDFWREAGFWINSWSPPATLGLCQPRLAPGP